MFFGYVKIELKTHGLGIGVIYFCSCREVSSIKDEEAEIRQDLDTKSGTLE